MGSQLREVDQVKLHIRMKTFLCLLAFSACVKSQENVLKEVRQSVDSYLFKAECWGKENIDKFYIAQLKATEKCMQMEPTIDISSKLRPTAGDNPFLALTKPFDNPFNKLIGGDLNEIESLWRNRRQVGGEGGLVGGDGEEIVEFFQNFQKFGQNMASSLGNLTCVLQEMKSLDAEGNIILDNFINAFEDEEYDSSLTTFAKDPVFVERMKTGYKDCYEISQNWPQQALNRNPMSKFFGRNMVFFRCAKKLENKCCLEGIMKDWLEKLYGTDPNEDPTKYGFPEDPYDAAALSMMVLYHSASPEEKFVGDFFWGN